MPKNLWILTEERPKKAVLSLIIKRFCLDRKLSLKINKLIIKPILEKGKFTFTYELLGIDSEGINKVLIKSVSGSGSFVDFLIFFQENEPTPDDEPLYAIEETKTDDSESRNTGVYQRSSKFVYVDLYYPNCQKIMLYNIRVKTGKPTQTSIFGTRMLLTLGVDIIGKDLDKKVFRKFDSVDELIRFKDNMRGAPKGNVPILISKKGDTIEVSGRLWKAGGLSHDPNIGALSVISKTLRELNWEGKIIITKHGLSQSQVNKGNKFVKIANEIGIFLYGLTLPKSKLGESYWHYEKNSEKIGTIFVHLICAELENIRIIFENHAGSEKSYFLTRDSSPIYLHKYTENNKAKGKIPKIPDLIIAVDDKKEILNLEGKTSANIEDGLRDIKLYDVIEGEYIKPNYRDYKISRGIILFGGHNDKIEHKEVMFLLNSEGEMIISKGTPEVIKRAIKLALDLNKKQ